MLWISPFLMFLNKTIILQKQPRKTTKPSTPDHTRQNKNHHGFTTDTGISSLAFVQKASKDATGAQDKHPSVIFKNAARVQVTSWQPSTLKASGQRFKGDSKHSMVQTKEALSFLRKQQGRQQEQQPNTLVSMLTQECKGATKPSMPQVPVPCEI